MYLNENIQSRKGNRATKGKESKITSAEKKTIKIFSLLLMIIFNLVNDENMVYPKPAFLLTSCLNVIVDPS